jgi:hypothetical protein
VPHGHHGGGGFHHGRHHHHHHHHHHRHMGERRIGFLPLLGVPLLGAFWRPRYDYGPRYRKGGCSIFALLLGILMLFAFIHFWWLLIPLAILAVLGVMSLLKSLTGRSASPGASYQAYQANQPYNQPYQQGYSAPPPPGSGYQPYPPQSGWGQYDMPQAQYPQNMPPMP